MGARFQAALRVGLRALEALCVVAANVPRTEPRRYLEYPAWDLLSAHRIAGYVNDGDSVLDVGSGNGHRLEKLAMFRDIDAVGVDLAPASPRPGVTLDVYDGHRLPFDDGTFDVVLLCYVLHHLKRPHANELLREATRVSRRHVILLEDSMPRWTLLYRWRNRLHRLESDLAYASESQAYRSPGDEQMFLTTKSGAGFCSSFRCAT
jgi:SAM-dependent methyltransferase